MLWLHIWLDLIEEQAQILEARWGHLMRSKTIIKTFLLVILSISEPNMVLKTLRKMPLTIRSQKRKLLQFGQYTYYMAPPPCQKLQRHDVLENQTVSDQADISHLQTRWHDLYIYPTGDIHHLYTQWDITISETFLIYTNKNYGNYCYVCAMIMFGELISFQLEYPSIHSILS